MQYDYEAIQAKLRDDPYYFRRQRYDMHITDKDYAHKRTVSGAIGGRVKNPRKGFGGNRELARRAGRIGGLKSRKGVK